MDDFRTDQTVNVDINLSREEIARLGVTRPFWKFVSFPIVLSSAIHTFNGKSDKLEIKPEDKIWWDGVTYGVTYSLPEDGDFTEDISDQRFDVANIGPKPEPIKLYVEKDKMEGKESPKETYISPFTGRVT